VTTVTDDTHIIVTPTPGAAAAVSGIPYKVDDQGFLVSVNGTGAVGYVYWT